MHSGQVQPGDAIVVVDAGPVGLLANSGPQLLSLSLVITIDQAPSRLVAAKRFGADVLINNADEDTIAAVDALAAGDAAAAIEPFGAPALTADASMVGDESSASPRSQRPTASWSRR